MAAARARTHWSRDVASIGGGALLALLTLGGGPAAAGNDVNTGWFGGVAIMGYDPVAYFTEGRPMKGSEEFYYEWFGTPWYFANQRHRELFRPRPIEVSCTAIRWLLRAGRGAWAGGSQHRSPESLADHRGQALLRL